MIKAEIISHEGVPGPNWLDRCRTLTTPGKTTLLVILLAIAGIYLGATNRDANSSQPFSGADTSEQANITPQRNLEVKPVEAASDTNAVQLPTVQAAGQSVTDSESQLPTAASDAGSLGASSTPTLNTATNPTAAATQSSQMNANYQGAFNGQTLTQNLQTTVQNLNSTVNSTTDGLRNVLSNGLRR